MKPAEKLVATKWKPFEKLTNVWETTPFCQVEVGHGWKMWSHIVYCNMLTKRVYCENTPVISQTFKVPHDLWVGTLLKQIN